MKKKLFATITAGLVAGSLLAGEIFNKGVDFTGVTSLTASKLNNIVDNAYPASHIGLVIVTNNTPSLGLHSPTNYVWLDSATTPYTLKTWRVDSNAWVAGTIAPLSVDDSHLATNAVVSGKVAANAIWTTNINDNAITSAKIQALAVTAGKYAAGSVDTADIAADAITSALIQDGTIASADIANAAITATLLAANSVRATNIVDGSVGQAELAANSVARTNVMTDAISSTNIVDGSIAVADIVSDPYLAKYTSDTNTTVTSVISAPQSWTHSLGAIPQHVRVVAVCGTVDAAWEVGDEINLEGLYDDNGSTAFIIHVNDTTVDVIRAGSGNIKIANEAGGAANMTTGSWSVKVYATYFK